MIRHFGYAQIVLNDNMVIEWLVHSLIFVFCSYGSYSHVNKNTPLLSTINILFKNLQKQLTLQITKQYAYSIYHKINMFKSSHLEIKFIWNWIFQNMFGFNGQLHKLTTIHFKRAFNVFLLKMDLFVRTNLLCVFCNYGFVPIHNMS